MKSQEAQEGFSFDWIEDLEKIKKKKLKEMLEEALQIQEKVKKALINKLIELDNANQEWLLKRFIKQIRKFNIEDFKEQLKEQELLQLISKKDWTKIKEVFWNKKKIDNEELFNFIRQMTFQFVEVLQTELNRRQFKKEVDKKVEETKKGISKITGK